MRRLQIYISGSFISWLKQTESVYEEKGNWSHFRQLETEYANLRVAFMWSLGQDANGWGYQLNGLRLAASLWHFWNMRGDFLEGYGWLQEAIEKIDVLSARRKTDAEARVDTNVLTDLQSLKATVCSVKEY